MSKPKFKPVTHYEIIARTHRPVPPLTPGAKAGSVNLFDISLFTGSRKKPNKLAVINFWTGPPGLWPPDKYNTSSRDKYLEVNAGIESFAGVVDILRNETNRYFHWEDPKDRRATAAIRTALEPTAEGDATP